MSLNFKLCVLCQRNSSSLKNNATVYSLEKIKRCMEERLVYNGENSVTVNLENVLRQHSIEELISKSVVYHKKCYADFTNKTNIERLKNKNEKTKVVHNVLLQTTRSARRTLPKTNIKCVLCCEESKEVLRSVSTQNVSEELKNIYLNIDDNVIKHRLSFFATSEDPLVTVALEIKYHSSCLRKYEREVENLCSYSTDKSKIKMQLAYSEIIHVVKTIPFIHQKLPSLA